jgi:1-acyl-sn-glycerol-3-phosphate acyltransferase
MTPVLRGVVYYAFFYTMMALFGVVGLIPSLLSRRATRAVSLAFFRTALAGLRVIGGVRVRFRGPTPHGAVLVAAKHQSMLDVCILYAHLPRPFFVMKRELARTPIFGWYATRVGTVSIDRSAGREATRVMVAAMTAPERGGGQIVIYPQGTRVAPGASSPYRAGAHALYEATGLTCIPAAVNTGLRQPRGVAIYPGEAVVEFLEPIPPGLAKAEFMETLERRIETASDALMAAG